MVSMFTKQATKARPQRDEEAAAGGRVVRLLLFVIAAAAVVASYAQWRAGTFTTAFELDATSQHLSSNDSTSASRWIPKTRARTCPDSVATNNAIQKAFFRSQSGEDKALMKWFGNLCEGSYIEMGALDGLKFSNSYVFNKALSWKGVLIEASPDNYKGIDVNRPNEIARINAAACKEPMTVHWVSKKFSPVNGIFEFSAPGFRKRWWGEDDKAILAESTEIQCSPLQDLLEQNIAAGYDNKYYFDFFSLDVEGAELAVLESIDFSKTAFGVIFLEADQHNILKNDVIRMFLQENGYRFHAQASRSYWFLHSSFYHIYREFV